MSETIDPAKPLQVWLIDAGLPGHTIQVRAVGDIFVKKAGAECHWIKAQLSVKGTLRSLTRRLVDRIPPAMAPALGRWMYRGLQLPPGSPDLIISSSSHTASLCRLLARMSGATSVFLGSIASWRRSQWMDILVVTAESDRPNALIAPLTQTGQTAAKAAAAAAARWPDEVPANCWTMVIGGNGKNHEFEEHEWRALAKAMNQAARREGVRWLISTSRRTGARNESILREILDPALIAEAIWWASDPQKGLAAYIHAGQRVFVTRDSMTMISEIIAVKGFVDVVHPALFKLKSEALEERYLARLGRQGRLQEHSVDKLLASHPLPARTSIEEEQEAFENQLLSRITARRRKKT